MVVVGLKVVDNIYKDIACRKQDTFSQQKVPYNSNAKIWYN
jgi:hypothetical protein